MGRFLTIPAQLGLDRRGPPPPPSPSHRPGSCEGDAKAKAKAEGALGSTLLQKKNTFGAEKPDLNAPFDLTSELRLWINLRKTRQFRYEAR